VNIQALSLAGLLSSGCAMLSPASNFDDVAGAGYLAIGSASDTLYTLCGNLSPGAACAESSPISTGNAQVVAANLVAASATITTARELKNAGDQVGARARMVEARRLIALAEQILAGSAGR
jgi:hypothetical protein